MATKATHTHFTSDKKVTHTQTLLHSKAGVAGRIGLRAEPRRAVWQRSKANTARSPCRWSVSGGRACGTVCVYHEPVDGASERLAGASDCSAARFSAAVADQNVLQPVVWQQAHGHAQLAAGVIETELAAGEGVLGLARANRPRRHVAARRGVTNMMLLQHSFIWGLSQWDGAAALPS